MLYKKYITAGILTVALAALGVVSEAHAEDTPPVKILNSGVQTIKLGGKSMTQGRPGVIGVIKSIDGTTLILTAHARMKENPDLLYTVDISNAVVKHGTTTQTRADLHVGDTIIVEGTGKDTTVKADTIRTGMMRKPAMGTDMQGNGQPVIGGKVTAIQGSTLTITNKSDVAYTVDISNAIVRTGGATSTASSIEVGDNVLAQGTINGTAVVANSVNVQSESQHMSDNNRRDDPPGFFKRMGNFFGHLFGF